MLVHARGRWQEPEGESCNATALIFEMARSKRPHRRTAELLFDSFYVLFC